MIEVDHVTKRYGETIVVDVRRMVEDLGKTVVVVLHDINFAARYSDHIVAMRDGRVAHQGGPAEIMRSDVLRALYDIDVAVETIGGRLIADGYG